ALPCTLVAAGTIHGVVARRDVFEVKSSSRELGGLLLGRRSISEYLMELGYSCMNRLAETEHLGDWRAESETLSQLIIFRAFEVIANVRVCCRHNRFINSLTGLSACESFRRCGWVFHQARLTQPLSEGRLFPRLRAAREICRPCDI